MTALTYYTTTSSTTYKMIPSKKEKRNKTRNTIHGEDEFSKRATTISHRNIIKHVPDACQGLGSVRGTELNASCCELTYLMISSHAADNGFELV